MDSLGQFTGITTIKAFGSIWSEENSIELYELVPQFIYRGLFALETSLTAPGALRRVGW